MVSLSHSVSRAPLRDGAYTYPVVQWNTITVHAKECGAFYLTRPPAPRYSRRSYVKAKAAFVCINISRSDKSIHYVRCPFALLLQEFVCSLFMLRVYVCVCHSYDKPNAFICPADSPYDAYFVVVLRVGGHYGTCRALGHNTKHYHY